jgi:hypothetical protein
MLMMELKATYALKDTSGRVLAKFHENDLHNFFRKKLCCFSPDGTLLWFAPEDSLIRSLLRRCLGPVFRVLRTNFIILKGRSLVGRFNRRFTILDRCVLDMAADSLWFCRQDPGQEPLALTCYARAGSDWRIGKSIISE